MAATSDSLETSHLHVWMRGWLGRISSTLASAVARAGSEMSAMRTSAPSRAKRMVVSRPMPLTQMEVLSVMKGRGRRNEYAHTPMMSWTERQGGDKEMTYLE